MRLIAITKLREAAAQYPDAVGAIESFYDVLKEANWNNLSDVRQSFNSADIVGGFTVFNIKGNKYRLILSIDYRKKVVYFKYFLTHLEYDKENWKSDPYY